MTYLVKLINGGRNRSNLVFWHTGELEDSVEDFPVVELPAASVQTRDEKSSGTYLDCEFPNIERCEGFNEDTKDL